MSNWETPLSLAVVEFELEEFKLEAVWFKLTLSPTSDIQHPTLNIQYHSDGFS
jgi:hypothetical protein